MLTCMIYGWVGYTKLIAGGDETISYLCAAAKQESYQEVIRHHYPYGITLANTEWQRFLKPETLAPQKIASDLVKTDIHPPLYFWLLHFFSFAVFIPLKSGLLLNFMFHLIGLLVIRLLTKQFNLSVNASGFVLLLWTVSPAIVSVGYYARQYEWLGLLNLIAFFCYLNFRKGYAYFVGFTIAILLGYLTHYLFIYFSLGYLMHAVLTYKKQTTLMRYYTPIALTIALAALYLIHPLFLNQFGLQQQRAQGFEVTALIERLGKIGLALGQLVLPLLELKPIVLKLSLAIKLTAVGCFGIGVLVAAYYFLKKFRNKQRGVLHFSLLYKEPLFLLVWSFALATFPYLLFLTPYHAMGPQYLTLIYPFALLFTAGLLNHKSTSLKIIGGLSVVGCIAQLATFTYHQQSYKDLVNEVQHAKLVGVNSVDRRGALRLFPYLPQGSRLVINEELNAVDVLRAGGIVLADEYTIHRVSNASANKQVYPLLDGVTLYVIKP